MIKSKINNHNYNLIDANNIFKCDKNNLEKLIIKYEKINDNENKFQNLMIWIAMKNKEYKLLKK